VGDQPGQGVEISDRRDLRRRTRLRLQHRARREEEAARAKMLEGSDPSRVQGRSPGRRSQLVGHLVHDARHDGPAPRRSRGLRVPEEAAPEREPVHQVWLVADQGGRAGRDNHRHRLHARRGDDGRTRRAHQDRRALRGHRVRGRLDEHHQRRQEPRVREKILRLGADGVGAGPGRQGRGLPSAVQQERRDAAAGPQARGDQAHRLRLRQVRLPAERKRLLEKWGREVKALPQ
jgi:hypothetical protein